MRWRELMPTEYVRQAVNERLRRDILDCVA